MRLATRGADLRGGSFDLLARARREPHLGARLRERDGAGAADAAAGAGDESAAVVEAEAGPEVHVSARGALPAI